MCEWFDLSIECFYFVARIFSFWERHLRCGFIYGRCEFKEVSAWEIFLFGWYNPRDVWQGQFLWFAWVNGFCTSEISCNSACWWDFISCVQKKSWVQLLVVSRSPVPPCPYAASLSTRASSVLCGFLPPGVFGWTLLGVDLGLLNPCWFETTCFWKQTQVAFCVSAIAF